MVLIHYSLAFLLRGNHTGIQEHKQQTLTEGFAKLAFSITTKR